VVLPDSHGVSRVPRYLGSCDKVATASNTGLSPSLAGLPMPFFYSVGFLLRDQFCSLIYTSPATPSTQPLQGISRIRFRLFRFRSPLLTESQLFSLPRGTEMFQFSRLPHCTYVFSTAYQPITTGGFPHSDTHGSKLAYSSPWHFGVRPVLRRLLAPRHPPCALSTFTCVKSTICFVLLCRHTSFSRSCTLKYTPSIPCLAPCITRILRLNTKLP
jgi:hypothetical protein